MNNSLELHHRVALNPVALHPGEEVVIPLALSWDLAETVMLAGLVLCSAKDNPNEVASATVKSQLRVRPAVDLLTRVLPADDSGDYSILVEVSLAIILPFAELIDFRLKIGLPLPYVSTRYHHSANTGTLVH